MLCVALFSVWWKCRNKKNDEDVEWRHDAIIHQIRVVASEFEQINPTLLFKRVLQNKINKFVLNQTPTSMFVLKSNHIVVEVFGF